MRVRFDILSYADVVPENLRLLRAAASARGIVLAEHEPHTLTFSVESGEVLVRSSGQPFAPMVLMHRTVHRLLPLLHPILDHLEGSGTVILNPVAAALASRNKIETAQRLHESGIAVVATHGCYPGSLWPQEFEGPVVIKPALGAQGRGVTFFTTAAEAREYLNALPIDDSLFREPLVIQRNWGAAAIDLRAYVVGGRCLGLVERRPAPGERRANLALGATATPLPTESSAGRLAEQAALSMGLDFCGVDLVDVDDQILISEVDAWAGFAGVQRATGVDIAGGILEHSLAKVTR